MQSKKLVLVLFIFVRVSFSMYCNLNLMQSYNLGGTLKPSETRNQLCHTIKQNCCSAEDQIALFDMSAGKLLPALTSYYDKMTKAFRDLEEMNVEAQKIGYKTYVAKGKRKYCEKKEEDFKKIKIGKILDHLKMGFEIAFMDFKDQHYAFYCVLCDYAAHAKITTTGKKITLDSGNCTSHILKNKDYIMALNIELVDYFKKLLHFLDCAFYDNSYEFPFLWENQAKFETVSRNCLEKMDPDSNDLTADCKTFCEVYDIAGISPHLEGDPLFIDQAVDYARGMISEINHKHKSSSASFNPLHHLEDLDDKNDEDVELFNAGKGGADRKLKKELLFDRRLLEEGENKPDETKTEEKKEGETAGEGETANKGEEVNKPSLTEKELTELYDAIEFSFNEDAIEFVKKNIDPVNLSEFAKEFKFGAGLLLNQYFEGLNFDINKDELIKLLKGEKAHPQDKHIDILIEACNMEVKEGIVKDLGETFLFVVPDNTIDPVEKEFMAAPEGTYEGVEILDKALADEIKAKEVETEKAEVAAGGEAKPAEGDENRELRQGHRRRKRYQTRAKRYRKKNRNKRYIRRNRRHRKHKRRYRYRNLEELTGVKVPFNNLKI